MNRVLVVDDDREFLVMMQDLLSRAGYAPVLCPSGSAALELLQQAGPADAAIVDLNMPGMDGLELCQRIRADRWLWSMPVLMLTGYGADDDVVEGYHCGADDYLAKPAPAPVLLARLKSLQRRKPLAS